MFGGMLNPDWVEFLTGFPLGWTDLGIEGFRELQRDRMARRDLFPTPTRADGERTSATYARGNPTLLGALLPTPTVNDSRNGANATASRKPGSKHHDGVTLVDHVRMFPTPTGRDWKDGSAESCANVPANGLLGRVIHQRAWPTPDGQLNPDWVELLMGFPLGWSDLGREGFRELQREKKAASRASRGSGIASCPNVPSGSDGGS